LAEFTGERVIPGEVEADLWNEHLARYAFAARCAGGKRILDAGCGTGYGSAELARTARSVLGIDIAPEAVGFARGRFAAKNVSFLQASCAALPVRGASVDLVVAFEVIEHLANWPDFLREIRRVLAPDGMLVISTPNVEYYAESRRLTGPNPFHVHEFTFDEFAGRLREIFPAVSLFVQNHVYGIAFEPAQESPGGITVTQGPGRGAPADAHFFIAVCGPSVGDSGGFLYLPSTANVLRERERHIEQLDRWLEELRADKQKLVEMFRAQKDSLDESNRWAAGLRDTLEAAQSRVVVLQDELQRVAAGYQAQVAELEAEDRRKTEWAERTKAELDQRNAELVECVRLLDRAEKTVIERTEWAQRLDARLGMVQASRWVRLGRKMGVGPALDDDAHA
jgi:SAM-dependent methyltransferase